MEYIPTIGLEIHSELKTSSKMFCSCFNCPDISAPNTNVCPVCLGHPGTLPVANEEAIRKVRMVGLALGSRLLERSKFDRKNYFYPDLPKGYQISQYDEPLCLGGCLEIGGQNSSVTAKKIRITRVHMEEDTGKLVHPDGADYSLVDFNRGGVPLMELVTEPDIENAQEAREFVKELQLILRYLGASDADMEKGKLRVEVNISLGTIDRETGEKRLGTKVEIKNLNSLKAVEGSVAFEIDRQAQVLLDGKKIVQETRGWDDARQRTFSQRKKEEAHDYRYFPEPDMPPMTINHQDIDKLQALIGELPAAKRARFARQYGLDAATLEMFVTNRALGSFYEQAMSELGEWANIEEGDNDNTAGQEAIIARLCANYLTSDVTGLLKGKEFCAQNFKATPENFAEFINLIYKREISSKIGKAVLAQMVVAGGDPTEIIKEKELSQINDEGEIAAAIDMVMEKNAKAVEDYRKGKGNAFQFLVGQVLAATRGRANPDAVKKTLLERIGR